jgi:NAD(P)-dependent dehydrogenase (short-subunit alcohol dehydrogenase family)
VPRKTAVLITGCSSGIGEAAALRLLKCGFLVFATVRRAEDAEALKVKAGKNNQLHVLLLDVTRDDQIKAAVEAVNQRLSQDGRKLLALINNAGYAEFSAVEILPLPSLRKQFEANVYAPVNVTRAFLPLLRSAASPSHSARLLFVSSIGGRIAFSGNAAYSSSKFAVEAIADAFRMELKRWNIHVSILEPGAIGTSFNTRTANQLSANWDTVTASDVEPAVLQSYERSKNALLRSIDRVPQENVSICVDAIEHALLDSHPQARMLAGWTSFILYLVLAVPSEVSDRLAGAMYA